MRIVRLSIVGLLVCSCALAQNAASGQASTATSASGTAASKGVSGQAASTTNGSVSAAGHSASAQSQQTIQAELTKSIDAKKAKTGDKVEAKTIGAFKGASGPEIPKGSKLVGHVTDVKARTKESQESTLAVAFDNAVLRNGQTVPLHALIVAAQAPRPMPMASADSGMDSSASAGPAAPAGSAGGPLGGVGSAVGGVANNAGRTVGGVASQTGNTVGDLGRDAGSTLGTDTSAGIGATTTGVAGLPGVTLSAGAANQTNGSVFRSSSQNVRLDSGTTLLLKVVTQ